MRVLTDLVGRLRRRIGICIRSIDPLSRRRLIFDLMSRRGNGFDDDSSRNQNDGCFLSINEWLYWWNERLKTRREIYKIQHNLVRIKAVVIIPQSNHQSSQNHPRLWITSPVPGKPMGSKFIHRFFSLHNHHTRVLANIHANNPINTASDVFCDLHDGMVNMFICSCSENSGSGIAVDVIVDHIDSVNDGIFCVWGGWWP